MEENKNSEINVQKVIAVILLIPPIIGVFLFLLGLTGAEFELKGLSNPNYWSGNYSGSNGGGYMSPMPIYLGLMAIAGAILLKNSNK